MQIPDTVFVSYSRHDAGVKNLLEPALRSTIEQALWVDEHRIDYGDRFDDEIRAALERSLAGVLLISQYFFDSKYIKTKELPFLVKQAERGKLALGIVYLTAMPEKPLNVSITLDGERRTIRLDRTYHSFTTPDKPLDQLKAGEQSKVFAAIADWADRKISAQARPLATGITNSAIAVRLRRTRSGWDRTFVLPDRRKPRPPTGSTAAPVRLKTASGETLFTALFGTDRDHQADLFRLAFGTEAPVEPTYGGLRIRLYLDDSPEGDELARAPWSELSWRGRKLTECDWSVELRTATDRVEYPQPADHTMDFPDRVVALGGDGVADSSHLTQDLPQFFGNHWQEHVPFEGCAVDTQFQNALTGTPRLVYYFGPADAEGLRLSGNVLLEWSGLATWLAQVGTVSVLYLNLLGPEAVDAVAAGRTLMKEVGAAILFHCCRTDSAPQAAGAGIAWLRRVLIEELDPIQALHRERSGPVYAWSRYTRWALQKPGTPDDPDFVNLFLDREKQRRELAGAKHDFLHSNLIGRIHHVVAYGEAGNLAADFPRAVRNYLQEGRDGAELFYLQRIAFEWSAGAGVDAIETAVTRSLSWQPGQGIEKALLPSDSNPGPETFCYVVLHWAPETPASSSDDAQAFMEGVADWAAVYLTDAIAEAEHRANINIRILSIITMEVESQDMLHDLGDAIEDLQHKTYDHPAFHHGELDRLIGVRKPDLNRFFRDEHHCRCTNDQRKEFPDLVLGGERQLRFDLAVETIRRGYPDNLAMLYEELDALTKAGKWPPPSKQATDFWKKHDGR